MTAKLDADGRTDSKDNRVYPAESAFSTPRETPAWRETSPSGGWRAVYHALDVPAGGEP